MNRLSFALWILAMAGAARAGEFAAGVMIGEPSGLSGRWQLDKAHSLDAGLAWSLSGDTDLQLHSDYLFHNSALLQESGLAGRSDLYYGLGGRLRLREGSGSKDRMGVRLPLGVLWQPPEVPFELFVEIVPVLDLVPSSKAALNGALGLRWRIR